MTTLTPRAEELLSYLTGLGPVGTEIEVQEQWLSADIKINERNTLYGLLKQLTVRGYVVRVPTRVKGLVPGSMVVIRRLEDPSRVFAAPADPCRPVRKKRVRDIAPTIGIVAKVRTEASIAAKVDGLARINEIPTDTRSLTGRICGDPLPGRSALDRVRRKLEMA